MPAQFPVYMLGILLFLGVKEKKTIEGEKYTFWGITLWSVWTMYGIIIGGSNLYGYGALMWGFPLLGIVISFWTWKDNILNNFVFSAIGKYSFGIYMFHLLVIGVVRSLSQYWKMERHVLWGIRYLAVIILAYLMSWFLTTYYADPINKFFKSKLLKK